jgi:hypothetical protein
MNFCSSSDGNRTSNRCVLAAFASRAATDRARHPHRRPAPPKGGEFPSGCSIFRASLWSHRNSRDRAKGEPSNRSQFVQAWQGLSKEFDFYDGIYFVHEIKTQPSGAVPQTERSGQVDGSLVYDI